MKAAVLIAGHTAPGSLLEIEEVPRPEPRAGYVLLRVLACGVCRTDLHIAEGDLPPLHPKLIPGHQIVGEVAGGATAELPEAAPSMLARLPGVTAVQGTGSGRMRESSGGSLGLTPGRSPGPGSRQSMPPSFIFPTGSRFWAWRR